MCSDQLGEKRAVVVDGQPAFGVAHGLRCLGFILRAIVLGVFLPCRTASTRHPARQDSCSSGY
eukprot:4777265-Lingulodinium_polyedra.AAC.1